MQAAAPFHLAAAAAAACDQLHGEVLRHTARVDEVDDPAVRLALCELRADALAASGEAEAIGRYREALRGADPEKVPWLRTRLGRAHIQVGDIEAAAEALAGVEPTGGPFDGAILLVQGILAYHQGDLETSGAAGPRGAGPGTGARRPAADARRDRPTGDDRPLAGRVVRPPATGAAGDRALPGAGRHGVRLASVRGPVPALRTDRPRRRGPAGRRPAPQRGAHGLAAGGGLLDHAGGRGPAAVGRPRPGRGPAVGVGGHPPLARGRHRPRPRAPAAGRGAPGRGRPGRRRGAAAARRSPSPAGRRSPGTSCSGSPAR